MEGKQAIKFDKYNSQAMKGIAIVIMLFHHMYLSQDRLINCRQSVGKVSYRQFLVTQMVVS